MEKDRREKGVEMAGEEAGAARREGVVENSGSPESPENNEQTKMFGHDEPLLGMKTRSLRFDEKQERSINEPRFGLKALAISTASKW